MEIMSSKSLLLKKTIIDNKEKDQKPASYPAACQFIFPLNSEG